jgi:putative transposase
MQQGVSPYEHATSFVPLRACNPTFASGHGDKDAWRRATAAVRAFRVAYRIALAHWCKGMRDVLFPEGTWWMRVFHGAGVSLNVPAA